jgi:hypothetical protein
MTEGHSSAATLSKEGSEPLSTRIESTEAEEAVQDGHLSITEHMLHTLDEAGRERHMSRTKLPLSDTTATVTYCCMKAP